MKQNIDELQQHANKLQQTLSEIRVENERLVNELDRNNNIEFEMSREREASKQNIERERELSEFRCVIHGHVA